MKGRSLDVLLLFILVAARVRIDTLAGLVAPRPVELLARIPVLPASSLRLLEDWLVDPYSLLLITATFALVLVYATFDLFGRHLQESRGYRIKLLLIYAIVFTTVVAQSSLLMALRHLSTPASFTHDGGVIQTEEAARLLLKGKNPYVEDYVDTPMAEWGLDLKTALYHFPYLPWTFVSAAPVQAALHALFGWYDQRLIYVLLFMVMMWLAPKLTPHPRDRLCLTMVLGLNPIMGNDVIFGQNDSFVLFWLVLFIYGLVRQQWVLGSVALGLAVASKPTAWFLVPFLLAHLWNSPGAGSGRWSFLFRRLWPAAAVAALLILPFAAWDAGAMFEDIWRWSTGTTETAYQIRGWGLANVVLALNLVQSRLDYFPFWFLQALFGLPLLAALVWRQFKSDNSIGTMFYSYALFTLVFLFFSRFLNENYIGYLLACFALGYYVQAPLPPIAAQKSGAAPTPPA